MIPVRTVRKFPAGKFWIALPAITIALIFFATRALAQSAKAVNQLSSSTQEAIAQLAALNQLPAAEWRYHVGDVAHGEAVDLDDKNWEVVKAIRTRLTKHYGIAAGLKSPKRSVATT